MKFADGEISTHEGGTTFAGETAVSLYRVAALKQALALDAVGIKVTRGTSALVLARQIAGVDFPRSKRGRDLAIAWCDRKIAELKGTAIED